LTLSRELASLEVALDLKEKESARQRRRIETNLLTISFEINNTESSAGKLGLAAGGLWESFVDGLAEALTMLSYGLPFLFLAFPNALLWRWIWRRITRRATTP
jgi:hypothetical protein